MKTRQKSESRILPQGRGNPLPIDEVKERRGGKETPVKEVARQLVLSFATAETPRPCRGAGSGKPADRSAARKKLQEPKAADKHQKCEPTMTLSSHFVGYREVVNRPVAGVITRHSEEPYVNSTSTVLWEVPGATRAAYPIDSPLERMFDAFVSSGIARSGNPRVSVFPRERMFGKTP